MSPEAEEADRSAALWPHVLTAALTLLIQLVFAAYVYGQLSATVGRQGQDIAEIRQDLRGKLDLGTYVREHPRAGDGAKEVR